MSDDAKRRLAWLQARRKIITSTDIPSIMGLPGAYGSPMSVYLAKTGEPSEEDEDLSPEYMKWGNRLQRAILEGYAEKMSAPIVHADPYTLALVHGHPHVGASLDAWRENDLSPVDAKNIGFFDPTEWGDDMTGDIPAKFVVQLTVQMLCTKTKFADLATLFGGRKLGVYRVELDPEVAAGIIAAAENFYVDHVVADNPPPVDSSDEWTRFLASRKQATERILTDPPEEIVASIRTLARARAEQEAVEDVIANHSNVIKAYIAENQGLEIPGTRITFKQRKDSTTIDWQSVAQTLKGQIVPEMFDAIVRQHTTTKPGPRVFLFKQKGDKHE